MGMRSDFYLLPFSIVLLFTFNPTIILASDITGTNIPNTIYGTMGDDKILGKHEKDNLYGSGGNDVDQGDDFVGGDIGKDTLQGNDGNDVVQEGSGADNIDGGKGNDTLLASFALGSVSFRDYATDTILCWSGFDTVYINPVNGDTASLDCESIVSSP